jgi:uncharacterized protein
MSANRADRTDPAAGTDPSVTQKGPTAITRALMAAVTGYRRFISPLLPPRCRFEPSCSAYALEALREHGAARGLWLAIARIARCHPFHPGGYDPVPPRGARRRPSRVKTGALSTKTQGS